MKKTFYLLSALLFLHSYSEQCVAKKYYKHVDENGIIHYSDKPPKNVEEFESWQVRAEDSKYEVKVINRGTKESPIFYAVNPYHGPIELFMDVKHRNNIVIQPEWPKIYVIPANSETLLATVKPKNNKQSWAFKYTIGSTLGDPDAVHDSNTVYKLPFIGNKKFYISQAFNGQFSHYDEQNKYALDIAMPEGSDILAARGGTVMDIAEDFYDGGVDAKKLQRGNYIRILHDDGSMAIYAHLLLESVLVAPGQRVETQQKIAKSGNTGYTSGPHLHFAVQINTGLKLESVPFILQHKSGTIKAPEVGPI